MSKNIFRICYFCILFSVLVACDNWDAKYPFKVDFFSVYNQQLPGYLSGNGALNHAYALSMIPDEDITIYGLRLEGKTGSWAPGKSVYEMHDRKLESVGNYPYTMKKGDEKIIYQTSGPYANIEGDRYEGVKFDVMKIYTNKGTWLIDIAETSENIHDKKFKAKESKDKFDKEKNESYSESIIKK